MTVVWNKWRIAVLLACVVAFGLFRISPAGAATPPANDDFNNATVITTTPFTDTVDTTAATTAPDDPASCGAPNDTVWYSLTPAVNETITANVSGIPIPTLSAYTGSRGALTQVACGSGESSPIQWSATAGMTYHIMLSTPGPFPFESILTLSVSASPPPANDDFNNATVISTTPFTDTVDTTGATVAPDDPASCATPDHTVWYSLTPAINETIAGSVSGAPFASVSAYTGARGALTQVACGNGPFSAPVQWSATAGVTYHIMLSTPPPFSGGAVLTLSVTATLPPANDDFNNATVITTTPFNDTVDTTGATAAPDDPTGCGFGPTNTVWYSITPSVNEALIASTAGSSYNATVSAYTGVRGALTQVACGGFPTPGPVEWAVTAGVTYHIMVASSSIPFGSGGGTLDLSITAVPAPANDDFANATVITTTPFTSTEDTTAATSAPDDPSGCGGTSESVWYSFTPSVNETVFASTSSSGFFPGQSSASAYTGTEGALTQVACQSGSSQAIWSATAGVTYHIMVVNSGGPVTLQVSTAIPPPNDDFDHATVVSALPFTTTLAVGGATTAGDDPTGCGGALNSVWFSFTPSISETITANADGSNYLTAMSAYTGSRGALTQIACEDGGFPPAIQWAATAGVTYHIMVADGNGNNSINDQLMLNLTGARPPRNDDFNHATIVSSLPFTTSEDATGATSAPDDPTNCGTTDSSVWYQLTPAVNELITVDPTGSSYTPVISVYTGSRGALTTVTCGGPGETQFGVTAGVTYHIMVANFPFSGGLAGHLALTFSGAQPPVVTQTFGAPSILLNGSTSMTFTISNPNASTALTGIELDDNLPNGLVISTPNGLSGSCGGAQVQAFAGGSDVFLFGATLAGGASCTFSLNVTGTTPGIETNVVGVQSTNGGNSNTVTTSVTVVAPPVFQETFGQPSIPFGGTTTLNFSVTNPNPAVALNGLGFTDTLPSGLVVSTPNGRSGSCGGGTIAAAAGSGKVRLSKATLAGGLSCSFSVNVTATSLGQKTNLTSALTSTNGGSAAPATATLTVVPALTTTLLQVSPGSAGLDTPVTFTATVAPSGSDGAGVGPTGTVSFFLDGRTTPLATLPLTGTTAGFTTSGLGSGAHTVTATYSGDANFVSSSSTATSTVTVTCTTTVTASHGPLVIGPGSTCVLGGQITGSVVVPKGAALDLEGATVSGTISATGASFVRICQTSATAVIISGSTGPVVIGDSGDDGCAPNTVHGSMTLINNTGGIEAIGNHVGGAVTASGNSGSGPLPGDTAPDISGNGP